MSRFSPPGANSPPPRPPVPLLNLRVIPGNSPPPPRGTVPPPANPGNGAPPTPANPPVPNQIDVPGTPGPGGMPTPRVQPAPVSPQMAALLGLLDQAPSGAQVGNTTGNAAQAAQFIPAPSPFSVQHRPVSATDAALSHSSAPQSAAIGMQRHSPPSSPTSASPPGASSPVSPGASGPGLQWMTPRKPQHISQPSLVGSRRIGVPMTPRNSADNTADMSDSPGGGQARLSPVSGSPKKASPAPDSAPPPASPVPRPISPEEYEAFLRQAANPPNDLIGSASTLGFSVGRATIPGTGQRAFSVRVLIASAPTASTASTCTTAGTATTSTTTAGITTTTSTTTSTTTAIITTTTTTTTGATPPGIGSSSQRNTVDGDAVLKSPRGGPRNVVRRSTSLANLAALKEAALPSKLYELNDRIEQFVKAETENFTAMATRRERSLYHSDPDKQRESDHERLWQPLMSVLAVRLKPCFDDVMAQAQASSEWKALVQKLERKDALSDATAQTQLRTQAANLFKPLLDLLAPAGKPLLDSILPPTVLHFMLELDYRHAIDWKPRCQRLLTFRLRHYRMKWKENIFKTLSGKPALDESEQKSLTALQAELAELTKEWKDCRATLYQDGESGQDQLVALARLIQTNMSPQELVALLDQSKCFDTEFVETRRHALAGFVGARGVAALFEQHGDGAEIPGHALLAATLTSLVSEHALLGRLLNCSEDERTKLRHAAMTDLPALQPDWEKINSDLQVYHRRKALVEKSEAHPAQAQANTTSGSGRGGLRKVLSKPREWPPEELAKRRLTCVNNVIEEFGIEELQASLGPDEAVVLAKLVDDLRAWTARTERRTLSKEQALHKCIELLSQAMLEHDSSFSEDLLDLLDMLAKAKETLKSSKKRQQEKS